MTVCGIKGNAHTPDRLAEKEGAVKLLSKSDRSPCGVQPSGGVRTPLKFGINRRPLACVNDGKGQDNINGELVAGINVGPDNWAGKTLSVFAPHIIGAVQPIYIFQKEPVILAGNEHEIVVALAGDATQFVNKRKGRDCPIASGCSTSRVTPFASIKLVVTNPFQDNAPTRDRDCKSVPSVRTSKGIKNASTEAPPGNANAHETVIVDVLLLTSHELMTADVLPVMRSVCTVVTASNETLVACKSAGGPDKNSTMKNR